LALATVTPMPAGAAPDGDLALSAAKASPELRTAVAALNESFARLEVAKAVFTADDLEMANWRARKRYNRLWNERRALTVDISWAAQMEAEKDFQKAQVAVANVESRNYYDIVVKAATSMVYDRVRLASCGTIAIIGYGVARDLIKRHLPALQT
jgi:hypothetical protein